MAAFVLGMLYTLLKDQIIIAGILFGCSVHFKLYPVIYAVPIWFGVDYFVESNKYKKRLVKFTLQCFSKKRIIFGIVSFTCFFFLNWLMYQYYGQSFLHETYLYHITRKDHRHNFSLYFLHMYLSSNKVLGDPWSTLNSLLSFVPQFALVFFLGLFLAQDLFLACFLQTFAFVALNKVCTSQYFMWYLCLLPLVLPSSELLLKKKTKAIVLLTSWIAGQVKKFYSYQGY
jgi:phosphatidylinositol glycan class M